MANQDGPVQSGLSHGTWGSRAIAGATGGLAGGLAMGLVLQFGTELLPVFGGLAGATTLVRGWIVHLITSVLFGVLFAAFVSLPFVRELATTLGASILLGVIHATALAFVTIGVILPLATVVLSAPEITSRLIPGPEAGGLVGATLFGIGHVLYGMVLGVVYAVLRGVGPW